VGAIHLVHGHYLQEWLLYDTDFSWRLDPAEAGASAMVGDAGCHWFDLVEHVTGLRVASVLAELRTVIPVRRKPLRTREAFASGDGEETEPYSVKVPDLGAVLLRLSNGGTATFLSSPLCAGHKNDLRFEIHGSKQSLSWVQENPNRLWNGRRGEPDQILNRDPELLAPEARRYSALPGGHNEGWPDAFKNTLGNVFEFISQGRAAKTADGIFFPTFADGCRAAAISDALVRSSANGGVWTDVEE
jgi:predicted dehydrogenase